MRTLTFGAQAVRDLTREVLLTDGLGGFVLSTLAGVPIRSYSALNVSLNPPVERHAMWIAPTETVEVDGRARSLHAFEIAPGTLEGDGLGCVESVVLRDLLPERRSVALGVRVTRRAVVPRHSGALVLLYEVETREAATLRLGGLFTDRDMHAALPAMPMLSLTRTTDLVTVTGRRALHVRLHAPGLDVAAGTGTFSPQRLHYRAEAERGEKDTDVSARADLWSVRLPPGRHRLALVVDGQGEATLDPWTAWDAEVARRDDLVRLAWDTTEVRDEVVATLAVAADAFLVRRASVDSTSVIAGYPWFADWGRDSMIALSGLALTTGRFSEAREVLATFLRYRRRGLVPNNFWDDGKGAGYNTVDGALWLFVAMERYARATGDEAFVLESLPALRDILEWHVSGTDFDIRQDADGLLRAGSPGVQLTWMDVKIEDWVVTPRHGRPVEIAALWLAALGAYDRLSLLVGAQPAFEEARVRVAVAFARFWETTSPYPADTLHDDGTPDPSVRPNALLALALPDTPRDGSREETALRVAERDLVTPVGLRTLSPDDPRYRPRYGGHRYLRDSAYHQGTVWPWPIGAYVDLLLRRGERDRARAALRGLVAHLAEAGVGSVSEVFGAEDLAPGGCPFQAWSVAELLRAHVAVERGG